MTVSVTPCDLIPCTKRASAGAPCLQLQESAGKSYARRYSCERAGIVFVSAVFLLKCNKCELGKPCCFILFQDWGQTKKEKGCGELLLLQTECIQAKSALESHKVSCALLQIYSFHSHCTSLSGHSLSHVQYGMRFLVANIDNLTVWKSTKWPYKICPMLRSMFIEVHCP